MAFRTNKIIFYHVPKTAGSWVRKYMRLVDKGVGEARNVYHRDGRWIRMRHGSLSCLSTFLDRHLVPSDLDKESVQGLFSFCFVRHPVEWYRSWWSYTKNKKLNLELPFDKCRMEKDTEKASFDKFIENVLHMFPEGFTTKVYQSFMGEDLKGIDFVGKQENVRKDLVKALTLAGEKVDMDLIKNLKRNNISAPKKHKPAVSEETRDKILKAESWVINNFYK